jgi:hypothetical protein
MKGRKKGKRPKVNLILSHVITLFLYWALQMNPKPLDSLYYRKKCIFNVKKGPIQGSIWFKLVPRLLVPRPLFKVALSYVMHPQKLATRY